MSVQSDWSSINKEIFARAFVRYHNALEPIMKRDMLSEVEGEPDVKKAIDTMLAEVKKHKMKLDWFQKRL